MNEVYLTVYTDGGSRGNPGPSAYGVVIKLNAKNLHSFGKKIGITTNNVAEYTAILEALRWIAENRELIGEYTGINFLMDSLLACQQLNGIFKIKKPHLVIIFVKIREFEKKISKRITYHHIPREKNKEADKLVNQALDNIV